MKIKYINIVLLISIFAIILVFMIGKIDVDKRNYHYYANKYESSTFEESLTVFKELQSYHNPFEMYRLLIDKIDNESKNEVQLLAAIPLTMFEKEEVELVVKELIEVYDRTNYYKGLSSVFEYCKYFNCSSKVNINTSITDIATLDQQSHTYNGLVNRLSTFAIDYEGCDKEKVIKDMMFEIINILSNQSSAYDYSSVISLLRRLGEDISKEEVYAVLDHFIYEGDYINARNVVNEHKRLFGNDYDSKMKDLDILDTKYTYMFFTNDEISFDSRTNFYPKELFINHEHYEKIDGGRPSYKLPENMDQLLNIKMLYRTLDNSYNYESINLENVYVVKKSFSEIKAIENYLEIEHIYLARDTINGGVINGSIEELKSLINLKTINISYSSGITGDISSLAEMKNLEVVKAFGTKISGNLQDLKDLENLKVIILEDTDVEGKLSSLNRSKELLVVNLKSTLAKIDFEELSDFLNIKVLKGKGTGDFESISNMKYLSILDISEGQGDINVLNELTGLRALKLNGDDYYGNAKDIDLNYLRSSKIVSKNVEGEIFIYDYYGQ